MKSISDEKRKALECTDPDYAYSQYLKYAQLADEENVLSPRGEIYVELSNIWYDRSCYLSMK